MLKREEGERGRKVAVGAAVLNGWTAPPPGWSEGAVMGRGKYHRESS